MAINTVSKPRHQVKNHHSGNDKPNLEDSSLNDKVNEIYNGSSQSKRNAVKSNLIERIGKDTVADVRQTLFNGIGPEHQRLIFDLFNEGSGKNLKENMERFRDFSAKKTMPRSFADTKQIFDKFYSSITQEDMPRKLKILRDMEKKAPELLNKFTKDEWNLIHSINHTH